MMVHKLNVIGLNIVSFIEGNNSALKKNVIPISEYFQFDVTPLDSNYPLIS